MTWLIRSAAHRRDLLGRALTLRDPVGSTSVIYVVLQSHHGRGTACHRAAITSCRRGGASWLGILVVAVVVVGLIGLLNLLRRGFGLLALAGLAAVLRLFGWACNRRYDSQRRKAVDYDLVLPREAVVRRKIAGGIEAFDEIVSERDEDMEGSSFGLAEFDTGGEAPGCDDFIGVLQNPVPILLLVDEFCKWELRGQEMDGS